MRRKYIIDPKFQWTIIAYTFGVAVVTTLGHLIAAKLEEFEQMQIAAGSAGGFFGPKAIIAAVAVVWFIGMFAIAVLFSNRLAGPLYRMRRHMDDVSSGKAVTPLNFRKDDYFADLRDTYNRMLAAVKRSGGGGGFSIIELMIAMAIGLAATMMAVVLYTGGAQAGVAFKKDVTNLEKVLLAGRFAAVTKNECAIVTRVSASTVTIASYPITLPCDTTALPAPDFQMSQSFSSDSSVSPFSSGGSLIFAPGGGTVALNPVTITLSSSSGRASTFTIYPAIGQVRHN